MKEELVKAILDENMVCAEKVVEHKCYGYMEIKRIENDFIARELCKTLAETETPDRASIHRVLIGLMSYGLSHEVYRVGNEHIVGNVDPFHLARKIYERLNRSAL